MINILLFGPQAITQNFCEYMGGSGKSQSAMVYFEFPNAKFQHPTIIKNFPEKVSFFALQPTILHSVIAPKREFQQANLVVWLFDWNNPSSLEETFAYYKKIAMTRKSFLPIVLIGYRTTFIPQQDSYLSFLKIFKTHQLMKTLIQLPVMYFEIDHERTESLFLLKIRTFLEEIRPYLNNRNIFKQFSTIAIEELLKTLNSFFTGAKEPKQELDDVMRNIVEFEKKIQRPITRHYLQSIFGCEESVAKRILDIWDERPSLDKIPADALKDLENEAIEMLKACENIDCKLDFVNLVEMGYHHEVVKYALIYLLNQGKIGSISHHTESQDYFEYRNIREVIITYEGRTLFVKTTNSNEDEVQLFSGMIQAIEVVRDRYLTQVEGREPQHANRIEFLEFGDLKALIGTGQKGVQLILRLNERPHQEEDLRKRIKSFLKNYENQVSLLPTTDFDQLKQMRIESERIFYQYFNPFPISFDVFKQLKVKLDIVDLSNKTNIEQKIIEILGKSGPFLLEDLIETVSKTEKFYISRSDLLYSIFDLIEEKIIV